MGDDVVQILSIEWAMFDKVNENKARASCQDDSDTFVVMRKSQFEAWDQATRASYLEDLLAASAQGRNLVEEKYKLMMCGAELDEMIRQAAYPPEEIVHTADAICAVMLDWTVKMHTEFPQLAQGARPVFSYEDVLGVTSIQTYLRCELLTYSLRTLQALWGHVQALQSEGKNLPLIILQNTIQNHHEMNRLTPAE